VRNVAKYYKRYVCGILSPQIFISWLVGAGGAGGTGIDRGVFMRDHPYRSAS